MTNELVEALRRWRMIRKRLWSSAWTYDSTLAESEERVLEAFNAYEKQSSYERFLEESRP